MSKQYFFILSLVLFLLSGNLQAQHFEYTPLATQAYKKILDLKLNEARVLLDELKATEPENQIYYFIDNYIDFFTIFINENESEFEELEPGKEYRLDKIKAGDSSSPYYLYTQAEINLQWALVRLKFEQYYNAFREVKAAYKLLKENQEKFPDFMANKKSLGILHALVGTVPDNYQWGVKILSGMEGSIKLGQKEIKEVLDYSASNDFIFEEETLVMYAFLMLHLNNKSEAAWDLIRSDKLKPEDSPLSCFVLANIAMRTGRNDEAIRLLENQPKGFEYHPFLYLDYMLGLAKLYRLENAEQHLQIYTDYFEGQNYIKEAYQKLAWNKLLQGDEAGYFEYMEKCKQKGNKIIGGDKNAIKEARSNTLPNVDLLKARLLFDGGYYQKAFDLLGSKSAESFSSKQHQLEYTYRFGRVSHKLGEMETAKKYYQKTIDEGRYEGWYFACNAALQLGLIYEIEYNLSESNYYYKLCLDIDPDEYKNGLHQQAKSGLNRINSN